MERGHKHTRGKTQHLIHTSGKIQVPNIWIEALTERERGSMGADGPTLGLICCSKVQRRHKRVLTQCSVEIVSPPSYSKSSSARSTPTRVQSHAAADSINYDVQTFGSSLPVKVMEALTMADGQCVYRFLRFSDLVKTPVSNIPTEPVCVLVPVADDQISVKVNESGWAWMVCGERLIIWKISQTAVAKVQFSRSMNHRTPGC